MGTARCSVSELAMEGKTMKVQSYNSHARGRFVGTIACTTMGAVVLMTAVCVPIARGEAPAATVANNKAVVQRSFEAWAAGTGGPYDLLKDDATWEIVGRSAASKTYPSREAFLSEVIRPFNARMQQPLKPVIRTIHAEGDTVIVLFDAAGVARDGKPYANTYSWHLRIQDGKIAGATAFFDSIAFNELWSRVSPEAPR
jgi:ketosteroid isomerase-like protein